MDNIIIPDTYGYLVYIASEKNDKIRVNSNTKLSISLLQSKIWLKLQDKVFSNQVRLSDIVM